MAIKVTLTNKSQQTGSVTSENGNLDSDLQLSRIVYQHLRSLTQSQTISADYDNDKLPLEYKHLLEELGKLQNNEEVSDAIRKLDEYLGSLGIDTEYHYAADTIDIESWLDAADQYTTRDVIDRDTGTNVIDRETGYNVVHNTVFEG